jgi:hypothetical protein
MYRCRYLRIQLGNGLVLVAQIPEQHGVRQRCGHSKELSLQCVVRLQAL